MQLSAGHVGGGGGCRASHLVWGQGGQGLDDCGQGHLRLLGHVSGAGHVVGRAADKPRAGVTWIGAHTQTRTGIQNEAISLAV